MITDNVAYIEKSKKSELVFFYTDAIYDSVVSCLQYATSVFVIFPFHFQNLVPM